MQGLTLAINEDIENLQSKIRTERELSPRRRRTMSELELEDLKRAQERLVSHAQGLEEALYIIEGRKFIPNSPDKVSQKYETRANRIVQERAPSLSNSRE